MTSQPMCGLWVEEKICLAKTEQTQEHITKNNSTMKESSVWGRGETHKKLEKRKKIATDDNCLHYRCP